MVSPQDITIFVYSVVQLTAFVCFATFSPTSLPSVFIISVETSYRKLHVHTIILTHDYILIGARNQLLVFGKAIDTFLPAEADP
jgi:hypothetical protein